MKEYKIRNLKPKNRIFLAPMLEPNDPAFRMLCHQADSGLNFTGMFSPLSKQQIPLEDKPAVQIVCNSPNFVAEFIKKHDALVSMWDLNLGCPSPLAKRNLFGVFLQDHPEKIEAILQAMRSATDNPISIKMRKSKNTLKILKMAEKYVDAISIHARTSDQGYSGNPDIEFALEIKRMTHLPIIFSGNVNKKNVNALLEKFDFVMIGRESLGNPSVFLELQGKQVEKKLTFLDYLELAKKYEIKFPQIKYQAMNFTKGMKNAKEIREKLIHVKTIEDIEKIWPTNKG